MVLGLCGLHGPKIWINSLGLLCLDEFYCDHSISYGLGQASAVRWVSTI